MKDGRRGRPGELRPRVRRRPENTNENKKEYVPDSNGMVEVSAADLNTPAETFERYTPSIDFLASLETIQEGERGEGGGLKAI